MGLDLRVPNGRCSPLLVGGCILLYIILICNWWSLSSQNYDLMNQINILGEQTKICCGERDQYTNDKNKLEDSVGKLKVKNDRDKNEYENSLKKKEDYLSMCKSELNSLKIVDASKAESLDALRLTLEEKKQEIKRLNEQIKLLTSFTTDGNLFKHQNNKDLPDKIENDSPANNKNDGTEETNDGKGNDGERDQEMANNNI